MYIEFPKSEITLIHNSNCKSDGVLIKLNNKVYKLENKGITIVTSSLVINHFNDTACDWVWFKGHRKQSLYDTFMSRYKTNVYMIPAQPFAVTSPAEIIVEKPENVAVPLLALILIIFLILLKIIKK